MTTTTFSIGSQVTSYSFGTGTIVSFENDNKAAKVLFDCGEKLMSVHALGNKPAIKVKAEKSTGQKRRERDQRDQRELAALSNIEKLKRSFMWINGKVKGDRSSMGYQIIEERLAEVHCKARELGNGVIMQICDSVINYMSSTEKQANVIAEFADKNGIKYH